MNSVVPRQAGGYLDRPHSSSLADVLTVILDKGLVIDAYVSLSVAGIQLLSVDARIVVASVDTYLRFAEATNRLDLEAAGGPALLDVVEEGFEHTVEHVAHDVVEDKVEERVVEPVERVIEPVKDAFEAVKETVKEVLTGEDEDAGDDEDADDAGDAENAAGKAR